MAKVDDDTPFTDLFPAKGAEKHDEDAAVYYNFNIFNSKSEKLDKNPLADSKCAISKLKWKKQKRMHLYSAYCDKLARDLSIYPLMESKERANVRPSSIANPQLRLD